MLPSECRKLTKTQRKNTNENVHSITTCKERQQKQRSRFLQEYKSEISYTLEDGHVGRNIYCRTATTKRKTIYNKAARRRQHNLKIYWTIPCEFGQKMHILNIPSLKNWSVSHIPEIRNFLISSPQLHIQTLKSIWNSKAPYIRSNTIMSFCCVSCALTMFPTL
jgi:hypothetical protein